MRFCESGISMRLEKEVDDVVDWWVDWETMVGEKQEENDFLMFYRKHENIHICADCFLPLHTKPVTQAESRPLNVSQVLNLI